MKLKKTVATVACASLISTNMAFASPFHRTAVEDFSFSEASIQDNKLLILSHDEMRNTEGEWLPLFILGGAVLGGALGAWGTAIGNVAFDYNPSPSQVTNNIVGGSAMGAAWGSGPVWGGAYTAFDAAVNDWLWF